MPYCIGMLEKRKLELVSERNRLLAIINHYPTPYKGVTRHQVQAWVDLELADNELGEVIDAIELNAEDPRKGW